MADNFGLKIGLEGEKEFKKSISEINQSFKVLGSEMNLVSSQFGANEKSIESLSSKNKVLNEEIEKQKEKINTLTSALENASNSFGENDRRTQNWQIQLNNAKATLNDMERELQENEEAIKNNGKAADDAGSKFSTFGSIIKGTAVAIGTAVVSAGAAAVSLGKSVIDAYSEYEQLVGGVDTLFKDSSNAIQEYAANAYKTAGMSANEYMSTVTGFSASLIASLDGDTEKAVKYADMAITDMSDNANKMGTSISTIQTTYQGFAKQNYSMLDNLKLGYGGTKSEMERLLKDAEAISGIHYDISSYADVVEAIHTIQDSMGIAGATAKEAETTIEGSLNSFKASILNLIVGFGDVNANLELLCNNVADSLQTVIKNITPVIENIIKALPPVIETLVSSFGDLLPTLLEAVTNLFAQMLESLLKLLPELIPVTIDALLTIVNTIIENLPLVIEGAIQIITALVDGIGKALPELIPLAINVLATIITGIIDNLPMLLDAAICLIQGLAEGVIAAIPVLIEALPQIISSIITFVLNAIPEIINAGIALFTSLVDAMPEIISAIIEVIPQIIEGIITATVEALPQIIEAGINLFVALIQNLPTIIETIVTAIPQIIEQIVTAVIDNLPLIIEAGITLFMSLIENLPTIIVEIVKAIPQIISALVSGFAEYYKTMGEIGLHLLEGLWKGISDAGAWLWEKISGFFGGIVDQIKDFFGIHSPSTLFADMGGYMAEGLGEGFGEEMTSVENQMTEATAAAGDVTGKIALESIKNGILNNLELLAEPIITMITQIGNVLVEQKDLLLEIGNFINMSLVEGLQISEEVTILNFFNKLFYDIKTLFDGFKTGFVQIGQRIMEGIGDGITSRSSWLNRLITSYIREMQRRVESMLGIHSPSREYAKIGSFMAEGMGVGFVKTMNTVRTQMEDAIPMSFDKTNQNNQTADIINGLIGGLSQGSFGNQNITLKVDLDSNEIAKTIFNPLKDVSKQRGVALG